MEGQGERRPEMRTPGGNRANRESNERRRSRRYPARGVRVNRARRPRMSESMALARVYAAKHGFAVFPTKRRSKEPATRHGCLDATRDPGQITRWWWDRAGDGVAIATGRVSGILVLDIDPRNCGDDSCAHLELFYGPLPPAPTVLTGGGGTHYYFSYPADGRPIPCRVGLAGFSGVDLKADGGYVVAPPSLHPDTGRRYLWDVVHDLDSTPLPPVPEWILELAKRGPDAERVPYERGPLSEESELRIANAIGLYEQTYERFTHRSRARLRGSP